METDKALPLLRSLKGAPLSVLIAMRLLDKPPTLKQLAVLTGYDAATCVRAIRTLKALGYRPSRPKGKSGTTDARGSDETAG